MNARIVLALLICAAGLSLASAEENAAPLVEFPCTLAVGQAYRVEIDRGRESGSDPASDAVPPLKTSSRFEVVEEAEPGFVLRWTPDWSEVSAMLASLQEEEEELRWVVDAVGELSTHELLIRTDESGTPTGLLNQEETEQLFRGFVERMIESLDEDEDAQARVRDALNRFLTPELLLSRALQDASMVFMFTGASYEFGTDYTVEDAIASPIGGDPLPSTIRFRVDAVDESSRTAHVLYEQETDGEAALALVTEFLVQATGIDSLPAEFAGMEMGIFAEGSWSMDLDTGMPREIVFARRIDLGPARRTDRLAMRISAADEPAPR